MKQSKLRRRRVFRYAILYFVMLVVFVGLIVGPIVAGKNIPKLDLLDSTNLLQPTGQDNDDTNGRTETGTGRPNYTGALKTSSTATAKATATDSSNDKLRLF